VDKQTTPTALHSVEMFAVEWNAWTNNLHVASAVMPDRLAWTEWYAVPGLEFYLLFQEKVHQVGVRRKFKPHRFNNLGVKVTQCLLPGFGVHSGAALNAQ
jgi:hypothetical protein